MESIEQIKEEWGELSPLQQVLFGVLIFETLRLSAQVGRLKWQIR